MNDPVTTACPVTEVIHVPPPTATTTSTVAPMRDNGATWTKRHLDPPQLSWIANFIWGIADDVLRDLYVRGKYRDVILPDDRAAPARRRARADQAGRARA